MLFIRLFSLCRKAVPSLQMHHMKHSNEFIGKQLASCQFHNKKAVGVLAGPE